MKKNKAEEGGRRKERPPKEVTFEEIPKREEQALRTSGAENTARQRP